MPYLLILWTSLSSLLAIPAYAALASDAQESVLVAVSSNFKDANDALAAKFHETNAAIIESTPGATGKLFTQIQNGAPFQIFLSADQEHAQKLETSGQAVKGSRFTYAVGMLVLYSASLPEIHDGADALKSPLLKHFAVANPEIAPYGSAAVVAMKALKLWDNLQDRVVYGENIAQIFQYAQSGAAEAGFVALSQVLKEPADRYWIVTPSLYPPLVQDAVLLSPGAESSAAKAYLKFLRSKEARKIIEASGYASPK